MGAERGRPAVRRERRVDDSVGRLKDRARRGGCPGAQRGEAVPGKPQPERKIMTPEEKAAWKDRANAEMEAHLAKMTKTKAKPKAILDAAKEIKSDPGAGRINFKSLETEK